MKTISPAQQQLARQLFAAKERRRLQLARLPIEQKIRMLVELQRLGNDIRRTTGRALRPEWIIESRS